MRPFSIMRAPPRRPRRAPNSGVSIRKPRMPNKETSSSIDYRLGKHHRKRRLATATLLTLERQKKIRAVHAKEKQQIRERAATRTALTCYLRHLNQVRVRIFYEKFDYDWSRRPVGGAPGT